MYAELGFIAVDGRQRRAAATRTCSTRTGRSSPTTRDTGELLNEYCVALSRRSEPPLSQRLPDADDVLAKWMSLRGGERELIAVANMHVPGRQVDPGQVRRDLIRLREWRARARSDACGMTPAAPALERGLRRSRPGRRARLHEGHRLRRRGAQPARPSGSPTPGSRRCPATSTCASSPSTIKEGVRAAGGTPMEFNTIAISDGITMGTKGMKTSLVSREVIADSIELTVRGYQFDAVVALSGCDKTIPGAVMALARLDIPAVMLYGGSIAPGRWRGRDVTIQDVFEAIGAHAAGDMSDEELHGARGRAPAPAPAPAAASSPPTRWPARSRRWASRPMGSAMVPAMDGEKAEVARAGRASWRCRALAEDLRPSKVITRDSLENAIACVCASGGSTNGVLHLLAVAREAGIELDDRRLRADLAPHPAARRPEARRALRRHRPLQGRRRRRDRSSAWPRRACCTATR